MVATTSFTGLRGIVRRGAVLAGDDPNVIKWPTLFRPFEPSGQGGVVEQATAAPGERRRGRRARRVADDSSDPGEAPEGDEAPAGADPDQADDTPGD